MLSFEQMVTRLLIALALGAILGIERELVGKGEGGVRTEMLVAGGATLFTMIALSLPYIVGDASESAKLFNGAFSVMANIVVGVGFLGAGLIIKTSNHPHGITTAALVWATAAIGTLVGVGMTKFAATTTIVIAVTLYLLRKLNITERFAPKEDARATL